MLILLSFLAGVVATLIGVVVYLRIRGTDAAELTMIALRKSGRSLPNRSVPLKQSGPPEEEKQHAMAANQQT